MIIPDYHSVSHRSYQVDGWQFDFQPFKFPDFYPMWQRAVFIKGPESNQSFIARIDDGHVYWNRRLPSEACQYYIEAIVVQEAMRVAQFFNRKYCAKKLAATLDLLSKKISLLGSTVQVEKRNPRK